MIDVDQIRKGRRNLFYIVIFAIALLLLSASTFGVFEQGSLADKIYETISTDFAIALLLVVFLVLLRSVSFLDDPAEEILQVIDAQESKLSNLEDISGKTLNLSQKLYRRDNVGRAYIGREEYYPEYYRLLTSAEKTAKLVGDGFRCHNVENEQLALGLYQSMKSAIENGVIVSRFQYHNTLSLKWLNLLLDLMENDFSEEQFRIYMNEEIDPATLPYVICLTDQHEDNASINIMFTMNADTKLEEKLGGPAFIFENAKESATNMDTAVSDYFEKSCRKTKEDLAALIERLTAERRAIVQDYIRKHKISVHNQANVRRISIDTNIPDIELIDLCLADALGLQRVFYFSFGSNLTDGRIQANNRAPSALCIDRGYIKDFEICFNLLGNLDEGASGGIANIRKYAGRNAYGALYLIDLDDFERLKNREEQMGYNTLEMEINKRGFGKTTANVFVADTDDQRHYAPTDEYAAFITEGMRTQGFPEDYQNAINMLMGCK